MHRAIVRTTGTLAVALLGLTACTDSGRSVQDDAEPTGESVPEGPRSEIRQPGEDVLVLPGDASERAVALSEQLYENAPVAVVAAATDPAVLARAAGAAVSLGAPLLLDDETTAGELDRLQVRTVLGFGELTVLDGDGDGDGDGASPDTEEPRVVVAPDSDDALADLLDLPIEEGPAEETADAVLAVSDLERGELRLGTVSEESAAGGGEEDGDAENGDASSSPGAPADEAGEDPGAAGGSFAGLGFVDHTSSAGAADVEISDLELGDPVTDVTVLTTGEESDIAAVATARSAGADVRRVAGGDPRATAETMAAVAGEPRHLVGLGEEFGDADTLRWRSLTAATGQELPGGGQLVFPGKRYVALYGTPSTPVLGVLGEQGTDETIERAEEHAAPYRELTDDDVIPTLEIIATVAAGEAGDDDSYSRVLSPESLRPLVEAAGEAGQYVLLDLQPGRASFVEQAELYADLLELPHVGLALDPEWNLGPDEVHMVQIGSTTAGEVNEVIDWLADFTRERHLPQKMLVLHQFQVRMIQDIDDVDLSRSELEVLVHADGQGSQPAKQDTWRTLRANAPHIQWWGWKNFYDEDAPILTPEQTAQVEPFPHFISYQ